MILTVVQAGITTIDPRQARAVFYNDMPRAEADYWISQLQPQSIGVFWSRTTYAAWRYIPTTYVLCGQDQCITLGYAEMMLQATQDSRPNMIDTIERCENGGHCIMLSRVEWTMNMLRRAAGERAWPPIMSTRYTPNAFSIQRIFDLTQIVLNDEHLKQARKFLKYMQKDEPSSN